MKDWQRKAQIDAAMGYLASAYEATEAGDPYEALTCLDRALHVAQAAGDDALVRAVGQRIEEVERSTRLLNRVPWWVFALVAALLVLWRII
jgi:type VI protein secretion system component VasF